MFAIPGWAFVVNQLPGFHPSGNRELGAAPPGYVLYGAVVGNPSGGGDASGGISVFAGGPIAVGGPSVEGAVMVPPGLVA